MARGVVRSVLDFFLFGLGIKALGFVRSILMARAFGVSGDTDAFYLALMVIFIVSNFLGGALTKVVIPVLNRAEHLGGSKMKHAFLNNLLSILALLTTCGALLLFWFAPQVMRVFSNTSYPAERLALATSLFRIGLPTVVLYNLASAFRGYLQSEMLFRESSLSLMPVNVVYIVYLVAFASFGLKGLMVAQVLGIACQFFLQAPALHSTGYRLAPRLNFRDPFVRQTFLAFLPVFFATSAGEINAVIDKKLASTLAAGSISALDISATFNTTLNALFVSAVTVVLFPLISKALAGGQKAEANRLMDAGLRYACLVAMPLGFALFGLAEPVVRLLFEGGKFDARATVLTAAALRWYSVGLFAQALTVFQTQVLYAGGKARFVSFGAALHLCTNVTLNLILMGPFGHAGLAAATSISALLASLFYAFVGGAKLGFVYEKALLRSLATIGLASAVMAAASTAFYGWLRPHLGLGGVGDLASLGLTFGFGVVLYGGLLLLLRSRESREALAYLKGRLKK